MRKLFVEYIKEIAEHNQKLVFITGDLGYNALEDIKDLMGNRFINAGVAEQNMVGVAAGMAYKGYKVICYSIAPFITFRCLEQIRLDVCLHNLSVSIVGNGGGYGYGIMGGTHHAIEDIAALSALPNIQCYVPSFGEDVSTSLDEIFLNDKPSYLRLGKNITKPKDLILKGNFRKIIDRPSAKITIVCQGAVTENALNSIQDRLNVDLFTVLKFPLGDLSTELISSVQKTRKILVIEEHMQRGGLAEALGIKLLESGISIDKFSSLSAQGYPSGQYGSQSFHHKDSGLDSANINLVISELIDKK